MEIMHVWPQEVQKCDGEYVFSAIFEGLNNKKKSVEIIVSDENLPKIPSGIDHFVLASFFTAIQESKTCCFHGKVSRSLMSQISEFNAIWRVWRPELYHEVEWKADEVVEDKADLIDRNPTHVFAYSGGVDATATLIRHSDNQLGWRHRPIGTAVMVHGFDIPYTNHDAFQNAYARANHIAASCGIQLVHARTNLRELRGNWEDTHGANIAAILHLFNASFEGGVIAQDEPYKFPDLPWGSNPVSNIFLGSRGFPIHSDGAELTRLEKVKLIARNQTAVKNLRVCWEGNTSGGNCGVCEKCVRTQLELSVFECPLSETFNRVLSSDVILNVRPRNDIQLGYLTKILDYADLKKLNAWWVKYLRKVVGRGICHQNHRFQPLRRSRPWKMIRKLVRKN